MKEMKKTVKEIGDFFDVYVVKDKVFDRILISKGKPKLLKYETSNYNKGYWYFKDDDILDITNFVENVDTEYSEILYIPKRDRTEFVQYKYPKIEWIANNVTIRNNQNFDILTIYGLQRVKEWYVLAKGEFNSTVRLTLKEMCDGYTFEETNLPCGEQVQKEVIK